jgi:hypothetical protein
MRVEPMDEISAAEPAQLVEWSATKMLKRRGTKISAQTLTRHGADLAG